jgi:hypothetical protein
MSFHVLCVRQHEAFLNDAWGHIAITLSPVQYSLSLLGPASNQCPKSISFFPNHVRQRLYLIVGLSLLVSVAPALTICWGISGSHWPYSAGVRYRERWLAQMQTAVHVQSKEQSTAMQLGGREGCSFAERASHMRPPQLAHTVKFSAASLRRRE